VSDFRIELLSDPTDNLIIQELDWDGINKIWTLSIKESDLDRNWILGETPNPEQLNHIFAFFRIPLGYINLETLKHLSPGELVLLHQSTNALRTVYAALCDQCGQHWFVFRWDQELNRWCVYGRTCELSWRSGHEPNSREIILLGSSRGLSVDLLSSP